MSLKLRPTVVQNLTHESPEMRLRALDQIEAKLYRAFAHKEEIDFSPVELFKQLIRWFGHQPVQNAEQVLVLMMRLVRSPYGPKAIEQLGLQRFIKELEKVKLYLKDKRTEVILVAQLIEELQNNNTQDEAGDICDMARKLSINDDNHSSSSSRSSSSISTNARSNSSLRHNMASAKYADAENELPWSLPSANDYSLMKSMADKLGDPSETGDELQRVLQHLQIVMTDYPAEYMLQAPHIFHILLELYERHEDINCPLEDIIYACIVFLESLKERLCMRSKCLMYMPPPKQVSGIQVKTQLKWEKTIHLLMEICVEYFDKNIDELCPETDQVLTLFLMCLEICEMQKLYVSKSITQKLIRTCKNLYDFTEQQHNLTLRRIKFLLFAFLVQQIAEINYISKENIKYEIAFIPDALIFDYALRVCCSKRYEALKTFWLKQSNYLKSKCDFLAKYETEMRMAAGLIKMQQVHRPMDIVAKGSEMKFTLEAFDSVKLMEVLYNAVIASLPNYKENIALRTQATNLLLNLLSIPDENKAAIIYLMIAVAIKKHFACLMNSENYYAGVCNLRLLSQQIIGVPLSRELLFKLIQRGFTSTHKQIKKNCEDIFILLLKSQNLLDKYWANVLELILPIMPLLQSYSQSIEMTKLLMNLFDPDAGNIPYLWMLQGNIRFLFHRDKELRNEALTRIIYILNTVTDASQYVPNIMEISDLLPNDICILKESRAFSQIFPLTETFNELSTLQNLLELLESPDIEPCIRKSTLLQINVMCQNWEMTQAMCNWSAHFLPLHTLDNSLRKDGYTNYTESAKPAIGILQKLLLCDSEFREELAANVNIYLLLLRALFFFSSDIQAQQDATMCLYLLTFSTFIVVTGKNIEVPAIMSNVVLPLRCQYIRSEYKECISEFTSLFTAEQQCTLYLRQFMAACFCDGGLLCVNKKWLSEAQTKYDLNKQLQLTQLDLRLVNATNPLVNLQRVLRAISNATDHKTAIEAVTYLKQQLLLYNLTTNIIELPEENTLILLELINTKLRQQPGNEMDFVLFEKMLEVSIICIRLNLTIIREGIFKALQKDFQHPLILLLQNVELPMPLYRKICQALLCIMKAAKDHETDHLAGSNILYINLFELFVELADVTFAKRDLQRMRCLVTIMQALSAKALYISDDKLMFYCKKFLNRLIELKCYSQTGAQLQRDCLQIVCSLTSQMTVPQQNFHLDAKYIKYLSGMCGHCDPKVRALAWCCLANVARYDDMTQVINELSYLPGGFLACCLSTLLDGYEMIMVRQMAGRLFAELLTQNRPNINEILLLLERHSFFRECQEALSCCELTDTFMTTDPYNNNSIESKRSRIVTCEIISCFCNICIELIALDADFTMELCEKAFMGRLYELLKLNVNIDIGDGTNVAYLRMSADICQLYALCSKNNFPFVQRTLCRDQLWLRQFIQLFGKPFTSAEELQNILQLLLAICKDTQCYGYLCESMVKTPQLLVNRLLEAFNITCINTSLQLDSLTLLSYLLIKCQLDEGQKSNITFIDILNKPIDISGSNEHQSDEKTELHKKDNNTAAAAAATEAELHNFESPGTSTSIHRPSAELIFLKLRRLFSHIYPLQSCKFEVRPSDPKIKICETLSILLKVSTQAQTMACNLDLLDRIIKIFNSVQGEINMPCVTFERRYGESKKSAVICNFRLLINVMFNWYASETAVLNNELQAVELTKVLQQIWPWLAHSTDLKILVLQLCQVLSERSLIVCKQFSTLNSSTANSILQLILKIVTTETQRIKAASTEEFPSISIGLRTVSNCCAWPEGRSALVKARALDIFDLMYPFNPKASKSKVEIVHAWLQFWELFSRYEEGAQARNLTTICAVINNSKRSSTRILLLKIVLNMSFLKSNCTELLNSTDFFFIVNDVIVRKIEGIDETSPSCNYEEELLACRTIWKLISYGVKYVAIIRGTKLAKNLKILYEHLRTQQNEDEHFTTIPHAEELQKTLEIIFCIFNS